MTGGKTGLFRSEKQKRVSCIVFGVYLILLIWLVLFKFSTSLSALPNIRKINWIPFYYDQETNTHFKEVFYNIIVFVPLGVYVQIFKEKWKIAAKCGAILGTSFLFEAVQFLFAIGASDITDLMGNTFGGVVGILFCMLMGKLAPKKLISIINTWGLVIEIAGVGLMAVLVAMQ